MRILLCLLLALVASPVQAYVIKAQKWPTSTVTYYVNPANLDGQDEALVVATLQQAASAWSDQTNATIRLVYGGLSTATAVANNRHNDVFFANESSGSTIAVCYYWWDGLNNLVDFDIKFFDAGFKLFAGPTGCSGGQYILDVATHEFGHGLGLSHTDVTVATMYPTTGQCSSNWRSLDADDIAGIEAQYPPTVSEPPAAPSGLTVAVRANKKFSSATLAWLDRATNEDRYLVERTSDAACFAGFTQIASVAANVSTYTDNRLGFGRTFCYRVRASNSFGFSDYSNSVLVTTVAK